MIRTSCYNLRRFDPLISERMNLGLYRPLIRVIGAIRDSKKYLEVPHNLAPDFLQYTKTARFDSSRRGIKDAHNNKFACLTKSGPTPSSRNRFTTICGSNIPNGSSQMASPRCVILTSHALRNYSKISHERDPTNLSPLFIACSNRHQTESTPQLLD